MRAIVIVAVLALAGCGDGVSPLATNVVAVPESLAIVVGDSARVRAVFPSGQEVAVNWRSLDTSVVRVHEDGWVHAVAMGQTRVVAEHGLSVPVTALPAPFLF